MRIRFNTLSYVPLLRLADSFVKSRRGAFATPASGLESRFSIMRPLNGVRTRDSRTQNSLLSNLRALLLDRSSWTGM